MLYRTITAILWLVYSSAVTYGMFFIYPGLETSGCVAFVIAAAMFGIFTLCVDKVLKIFLYEQ